VKTQNQEILAHLKKGESITANQAIKLFRCFRLAARIADLRAQGNEIVSQERKMKSKRSGRTIRYASYRLAQ